ncbi:MAG: endonuclease/exonuclease/phosphatase family protein [Cyclobacteriaceae bacterium]|nr:endonuclease/exonuclease/phosphatase family protein [Cyclobacteriaceae bacterium HetDA_MAG_MS6]
MAKKFFLTPVLALVAGIVLFYFVGSSATLRKEEYNVVKTYTSARLDPAPDTLTVLTYNIGYLSGMTNNLGVSRSEELFSAHEARVVELLNDLRPDLAGFQEIDFESSRSLQTQQLDLIGESCGYANGFQSINWDKRYVPFPYWPPKHHFGKILSGQAIVSRTFLKMDQTIVLSKPVNAPFYYNSFYLDRLIQIADWSIGDQVVKVMNVHLEAFDLETRLIHAKVVKDLFESFSADMPVLLIGDFNSEPPYEKEDDAMSIILRANHISSAISQEMYQDNPSIYHSFDSGEPFKMIDYILFNENFIKQVDARVVHEAREISDHLPVIMKFTFVE